ncbi:MAG: hypothetical protein AB7K24_02755 [Gemmataceae bacterium]
MDEVVLIAGNDNPALADHAMYAHRQDRQVVLVGAPRVGSLVKGSIELHQTASFTAKGFLGDRAVGPGGDIVVYLESTPTEAARVLQRELAMVAKVMRPRSIVLVSTYLVHLGDDLARRAEEDAIKRFRGLGRIVVFRPGHVLSPHSHTGTQLRRLGLLYALLPGNLQGTCVDGDQLFAAIENESAREKVRPQRTYTLLGPNRPWHAWAGLKNPALSAIAWTGRMLATLFLLGILFKRFGPRWLSVDTLRPASIKELLALYNPYNHRHVKIVGYNNGVVHFGHRYSGKTIVSTVHCNRLARVRGLTAQFDGGVTIRKAMTVLAAEDKELHVIPNYSYVTLGTGFFVPIHGSASQFCTIGETINKVWLYEPDSDRVIAAVPGDEDFGRYLYNLSAEVLVWRVQVQVKERSLYSVQQEKLAGVNAEQVWNFFHDDKASNVEIRKAGSAAPEVSVYRYYVKTDNDEGALEVPRDRLGSLWDRLEENPLTSYPFHALTRWLAHHVELFLSRQEFEDFWNTHGTLKIAKIQLRFIKRDGFPNSPFRAHDCVSADLFMLRRHKQAFEDYLRRTLPAVKMNPGKHSR